MNARRFLSTSAVATAAVLLSIGVQTLAYTAPTAAPTGNDADAPLNVGSATQLKNGPLYVNSSGVDSTGLRVGKDIKTILGSIKVVETTGIGAVISPKYCFGTPSLGTQDITPTTCITSWSQAGGAVSLTAGSGITVSPSPITGTGSIAADTTYVQRRVSSTCAVGQAIRAIAADGTVTCDTTLQTRVSGSCPVGATITGVNANGTVTCGPVMRVGIETGDSTTHTVSISPAMPDATYVISLTYGTGGGSNSNDCYRPQIDTNTITASSFQFRTPDACSTVTYNWIAIDR